MKPKQLTALLHALAITICGFANNIQVTNISLTGQNATNNTVQVQFTVSWQNSWRVSAGPANWDAAWIFVKYRVGNGDWGHARLNVDINHVAPPGSIINTGLLTPGAAFNATSNPGIGAFIYRSANGNGTFTAQLYIPSAGLPTYWWSGAFNTFFWIDPEEELIMILMTQFSPYNYYPIYKEFQVLVYQAIVD